MTLHLHLPQYQLPARPRLHPPLLALRAHGYSLSLLSSPLRVFRAAESHRCECSSRGRHWWLSEGRMDFCRRCVQAWTCEQWYLFWRLTSLLRDGRGFSGDAVGLFWGMGCIRCWRGGRMYSMSWLGVWMEGGLGLEGLGPERFLWWDCGGGWVKRFVIQGAGQLEKYPNYGIDEAV